jgi:16S rRNA (uracil1498-N3)-methyltransferase
MLPSQPKHRFRVTEELVTGAELTLGQTASAQISKVLRMRPGDEVILFNGSGYDVVARIIEAGRRSVIVRVEGDPYPGVEPGPPSIHLFQSLIKADVFELVVQKATELGVSAITAIKTGRSVVKLSADRSASRIERWQRISTEALEQSERSDLVQINEPLSFHAGVDQPPSMINLIAVERSDGVGDIVQAVPQGIESISILIGPEGGFASDEIDAAIAAGWIPVSLGDTILRSETASIAAVAIIRAIARTHPGKHQSS